ncbi:hypothetical protein [Paenibacillus sp. KN14-4R]|uniref:hypothetical protein n=1 Tax=Paenibacillus sp. KN14-4R TaxID=3445773 RepID=UPI003FA05FD1
MHRNWHIIPLTCLCAGMILLAGCDKKEAAEISPTPDVTNNATSTPNTTTEGTLDPTQTPNSTTDTTNETTAESPIIKPKVDSKDSYRATKPTLMGISLQTSKEATISRFGNPPSQFRMEDDAEAINVLEYMDFSVGFNNANKLQFIEVRTPNVDPGLNGLRLGQRTQDIVSALGKPDQNSKYVLSYKSQGTVLKFDIDIKEDRIQSIKLFAGT